MSQNLTTFFSTVFQKVATRCLRYAIVISHLRLFQSITDISFVGSLMIERFDEFKIFRNWDKNVNFIIFNFLGKRSEIEHRLHRLY